MAYAQWVVIQIINSFRQGTLNLKDAEIMWGKFYKNDNKDFEMNASEVNNVIIPAGSEANISSCGRSDAPSGTEGQFNIYDGETKICTIYWSCPWGSSLNEFRIQNRNRDYGITLGDWDRESSSIGKVEIDISRKG